MQHATSISAEEQRLAAMRSGGGVQGEGGQDLYYNLTCIYDPYVDYRHGSINTLFL